MNNPLVGRKGFGNHQQRTRDKLNNYDGDSNDPSTYRMEKEPHPYDSPFDSQWQSKGPPETTFDGVVISFICWMLILALVGVVIYSQSLPPDDKPDAQTSPAVELSQLMIQGKLFVGLEALAKELQTDEMERKLPDAGQFEFGSVRNRLAVAVLISELNSPDEALKSLDRLRVVAKKESYKFSEDEHTMLECLTTIFRTRKTDDINPQTRKLLRNELLWFGELVLHPQTKQADSPERTRILKDAKEKFMVFGVGILMGGVGLIAGAIGLIILIMMALSGKLAARTPNYSKQKTVYLEAFAVWMLAFMLTSLILDAYLPPEYGLAGTIVVFLASFVCGLFWTVVRGCPISETAADIGAVGNPITEGLMGFWAYLCSLPILLLGFGMTIYLLVNFPMQGETSELASGGPGHPILGWMASGDVTSIVLAVIVACVCAPVVEETVFRGLLYRSLRDGTHSLGRFVSVMLSALINGLIFAAIHPQGLYFIPVLASLAFAFSLAREWRNSLWTPMAMHAIHNGILTALIVFMFAT